MFKKIFEYAGPYKKNMYVATVVVLVSVLMGILPLCWPIRSFRHWLWAILLKQNLFYCVL